MQKWQEIPLTEEDLAEKLHVLSGRHHIDIVTSREHVDEQILLWLNHHNITYNRFLVIPLTRSKVEHNYDVYIDDSPVLATELLARGKPIFLYDRPWNKHVQEGQYVRRFKSFGGLLELL